MRTTLAIIATGAAANSTSTAFQRGGPRQYDTRDRQRENSVEHPQAAARSLDVERFVVEENRCALDERRLTDQPQHPCAEAGAHFFAAAC